MEASMMIKLLILWLFMVFLITLSSAGMVRGRYEHRRGSKENNNNKLYVFGDSYVDTGNWDQSIASSWKVPYGVTFPGKPSGRFSDGRVLTDYIGSYLGIPSPIPYERRKSKSKSKGCSSRKLQFGMNFAYGGTGVFDTDISKPNMTSQINLFEKLLIKNNVYCKSDLQSSVALVSLAGNDYSNYLKHGSKQSLEEFTKSVVNQLVVDLQHIHNLGVPKIVITAMEPLGCLPVTTSLSGYKNCTESFNNVTRFHNELLHHSVDELNKKTTKRTFFVIDLFGAFLSLLEGHKNKPGSSDNVNILKPCCEGTAGEFGCGNKDGNKTKYTLCKNPNLAFFWDTVHPTQNGWHQVYRIIKPTLKSFF